MKKYFILVILICISLLSCEKQKKEEPVTLITPDKQVEEKYEKDTGDEREYSEEYTLPSTTKVDLSIRRSNVQVTMPDKYLKDVVVFSSLPEVTGDRETAVIGSNVAKFFPDTAPESDVDTDGLESNIQIPLGTVIVILGKYINTEDEYNDLFYFEEDYNYFYRAEYKGETGMVWGADLTGLGNTEKENAILSFYYTKKTFSEIFYDFNGVRSFSQDVKKDLVENNISFESVDQDEYYVSVDRPDDLVSLYQGECSERENTVFISTDLFIHSLHLLFDKVLAQVEEDIMFYKLRELTLNYISEIDTLITEDDSSSPVYSGSLRKAKIYFEIPLALLQMAPIKKEEQWGQIEYIPVDEDDVMNRYSEEVQAELQLILDAGGRLMSPNFNYLEDYTQFKPRGHYTKNGILEAYFRAMMWYGRIHLVISSSESETLDKDIAESWGYDLPEDYEGGVSTVSISQAIVPIILIINKIASDNSSMFYTWEGLFDPITYLIGPSDDLNFTDIFPTLDYVDWNNYSVWLEDPGNILSYIKYVEENTTGPLIAGSDTYITPSEEDLSPSKGFRLFGQRFTVDSYLHNQLTHPRLPPLRGMVTGLEIMSIFGSQSATLLLEDEFKLWEPFLEERLYELKNYVSSLDDSFWSSCFYNQYLLAIKNLATFEQGAGYFFTKSGMWDYKALITAHAAWAELRHDTILYVKQSYAELAGGGYEPTYRTIPFERPIHYIEPNLMFFYALQDCVVSLTGILSDNDLLTETYRTKFTNFMDILNQVVAIVEKEVQDIPITFEQNEFIVTIPDQLARIVVPASGDIGYVEDRKELLMACIADVHTAGESVLEVGTGIPIRIYVALNDGQGGKRIATGYMFSYYEFTQPTSNRLNDDQWKEMVYEGTVDMNTKLPFWLQGLLD